MKALSVIVFAAGFFLGALAGLDFLGSKDARRTLDEIAAIAEAARVHEGTNGGAFVVERVVDGDTIVLSGGEHVRYIGVDTPEIGRNGRPSECFAEEATRRNAELVLGKRVSLITDKEDRDRYGRLLRFVLVEGKNVNLTLVEEGYAKRIYVAPNNAMQEQLTQAERVAKHSGLGLWSACR